MRFQEITPSMITLLVGGILAIIIQLPIINEIFPIVASDASGVDGGINLLATFGDVNTFFGDVDGWTMIGLPGIIWWILLIIGGILCIIPAVHKFQPFIPETELPIPGDLPFLLAIIGGILQILIVLLILIGANDDKKAYGVNMLDAGSGWAVGFGFYIMLIAAIVSIVGAILLYLEEAAA
ncbi:MAG: hypothetical protein ACXACI_15825 [Candidatus Hodarchaeales archaeon]|jgi:hypothetical protein